jgi:hypothetical protein
MGEAEKSYDEIVDLFARGGGAGAVLAFRPSAEAKARVQELLERSKRYGASTACSRKTTRTSLTSPIT